MKIIISLLLSCIAGSIFAQKLPITEGHVKKGVKASIGDVDSTDSEAIYNSLIVAGNSTFAFDLYAELSTKKKNFFFSPYSISTALAMTFSGAGGETAAQMATTMRFFDAIKNEAKFHLHFGKVAQIVNEKRTKLEINVANKLFVQEDMKLGEEFSQTIKDHYEGAIEGVDYKNDAEGCRKLINKWVEKATKDKIKNLIKSGMVDQATRLILVNAIYFKGAWVTEFKEKNTKEEPFFVDGKKEELTPLMHGTFKAKFFENNLTQMLELPYNGDMSMIILLPRKKKGLPFLESSLSNVNFKDWCSGMRSQKVNITLPKFKMKTDIELKDILVDMGMVNAFGGLGDFGKITQDEGLFISKVVHQAFVDVNEKGTEAAAATAVVMKTRSVSTNYTPVFRADHPFIFLIRDNRTKSILFLGRMIEPAK